MSSELGYVASKIKARASEKKRSRYAEQLSHSREKSAIAEAEKWGFKLQFDNSHVWVGDIKPKKPGSYIRVWRFKSLKAAMLAIHLNKFPEEFGLDGPKRAPRTSHLSSGRQKLG